MKVMQINQKHKTIFIRGMIHVVRLLVHKSDTRSADDKKFVFAAICWGVWKIIFWGCGSQRKSSKCMRT